MVRNIMFFDFVAGNTYYVISEEDYQELDSELQSYFYTDHGYRILKSDRIADWNEDGEPGLITQYEAISSTQLGGGL